MCYPQGLWPLQQACHLKAMMACEQRLPAYCCWPSGELVLIIAVVVCSLACHFLLFWERLILACRLILKLGSYQGLELNCQCNLKCLMIMGHIYKNKPVAIVSFELQSVLIAKVASYNGYCSIQYKHRIVFLHYYLKFRILVRHSFGFKWAF